MDRETEKEPQNERDKRNDEALEAASENGKPKAKTPDAAHGKRMEAILGKLDKPKAGRKAKKKDAGRKAHGRSVAPKAKAKHEGGTYPAGTAKRKDGQTGDNPCLCGCGRRVRRFFSQGHDARVKGWLKARAEGDETVKMPAILVEAIGKGLVLKAREGGNVLSGKATVKAA